MDANVLANISANIKSKLTIVNLKGQQLMYAPLTCV